MLHIVGGSGGKCSIQSLYAVAMSGALHLRELVTYNGPNGFPSAGGRSAAVRDLYEIIMPRRMH
jgi:hypothetical protein